MGIMERFSTIMKSNINSLLEKAEDPEKIVEQNLLDLRKDLADVKRETAEMMAVEQQAKQRVEECEADISRYATAAANALRAGADGDARKLIATKQKLEANLPALRQSHESAVASTARMREMFDKLTADIDALEIRKEGIQAKMTAAKAQEKVNQITAGSVDTGRSIEAFERMEDKADRMFDTAMAEATLNGNSDAGLLDKYSGTGTSDVDDELARMKQELGL